MTWRKCHSVVQRYYQKWCQKWALSFNTNKVQLWYCDVKNLPHSPRAWVLNRTRNAALLETFLGTLPGRANKENVRRVCKSDALLHHDERTLYIFRSPEFIFSQLSTALISFSIGDVSPRFPFLTCGCYSEDWNKLCSKIQYEIHLRCDPPRVKNTIDVMGSPVLQTALMIDTCIHPQKFGGPG